MRSAFYNEIEPYAVRWLENLRGAGRIAPGAIDARSIREVQPDDVRDAVQAHFFAGIGVWSYALRLAGVPDDAPVWTGSCPCQPWSTAGKQRGEADERHLWPEWFRLIRECRPPILFGEQVASKDGYRWLDLVHDDLEGAGYAVGSAVLPAACVGAPHGRHRIFFGAIRVADADGERRVGLDTHIRERGSRSASVEAAGCCAADCGGTASGWNGDTRNGVAYPERVERGQVGALAGGSGSGGTAEGLEQRLVHSGSCELDHAASTRLQGLGSGGPPRSGDEGHHAQRAGAARSLADACHSEWRPINAGHGSGPDAGAGWAETAGDARSGRIGRGPWTDCAWIPCRDGKARPVEPGSFPLAHGAPARVGRLRAYGNAIVPQVAAHFICCFLDACADAGLGAFHG